VKNARHHDLDGDVGGDVPSLVICLLSFGGFCFAQEPPEAAAPGAGGRGSAFAPSGWLELIVDVSIRATKFLTITASYMDYSVPASGLNELPSQPARFTRSYEERQFRIDCKRGRRST
jgi:hypothetical protein